MTNASRILIIEDEPLITMMLEDFLDVLGKTVAGTADSLVEGLALVECGGIDAAILDLNLRGEKSWPIADALATRGIPFMLASGGGDDIPASHADRPRLHKPFTMDRVRQAFDEL